MKALLLGGVLAVDGASMKALLLGAILAVAGVFFIVYQTQAQGQSLPPVGGLCNTLEQSRSIMSLRIGPPALIRFRQLTFEGECFMGILIPVTSICFIDTATYPARPGRVFNTYRFTDPSGVERYGAAQVPGRLNSFAGGVSTGTCGGEEA